MTPEMVPSHWLAYAKGTAKEKGVADAEMVMSIDRHFGLVWHLYMTQYYPDIKRLDHSSEWFLSKRKVLGLFEAGCKTWGLQVLKKMEMP